MKVISLTFLCVLLGGLATVAVPQLYENSSPDFRSGSTVPFVGDDLAVPIPAGSVKPVKFFVHTPTGEPAGLAKVEAYRGHVVKINIGGDAASEIKCTVLDGGALAFQLPRLSVPVDGDGTFEAAVASHSKLVVVHDSGYAIHAVTSDAETGAQNPRTIKLQPWGKVAGKVTFNKQPPTEHRVSAHWESFPISPSMLNLPADQRIQGPPLVSISQTVDVSANGEYTITKLPPGRLRLTVATSSNEGDDKSSSAIAGNVQWWQTAVATKVTESTDPFVPTIPDQTVFDFSVVTVKGRLKMTDELFERRLTVTTTPSGVETGQAELRVTFARLDFPLFGEAMTAANTLEQAVREAVVWGRPGGRREASDVGTAHTHVDRNGEFEAVLLAGEYDVGLKMSEQRHIGPRKTVVVLETLASSIARVPDKLAGDDADQVLDLGEIQVELVPGRGVSLERPGSDTPSEARVSDSDPLALDDVFNPRSRNPIERPDDTSKFEADLPDTFPATDVWEPNRREPIGHRENLASPTDRSRALPDTQPDPAPGPTITPVDQAIARLVTDLLAAGDRRTRENMRTPLMELLQQKFDAEQQARETLLKQLRARLEEASKQVTERKQNKDQIVTQQLERMLSLPEDNFLPMDYADPQAEDRFQKPAAVDAHPLKPPHDPVLPFTEDRDDDVDSLESTQPLGIKLLVPEIRFREEGGEGSLRVSYDDIDLLKVLNMQTVPVDAVQHFPEWLAGLDGQRIRIRGFMYPTFEATGLTRFTLARDSDICRYLREPKIYEVIAIQLADGETSDNVDNEPFDVEGVFRIVPEANEEELSQLYRIEEAKVFR